MCAERVTGSDALASAFLAGLAEDKVSCSHCWRLLHFHAHDLRRVPGLVSA